MLGCPSWRALALAVPSFRPCGCLFLPRLVFPSCYVYLLIDLFIIYGYFWKCLVFSFSVLFIYFYHFSLLLLSFVLSPFDHKKPSPPPKSAPYKPVPPPKPKNYRPPPNASSTSTNQQPMTPNSNYWNHSPPGTLNHPHRAGDAGQHGYYAHGPPPATTGSAAIHNGHNSYRYEDDTNGGFDSGTGIRIDQIVNGAS